MRVVQRLSPDERVALFVAALSQDEMRRVIERVGEIEKTSTTS
jgi:hypothetical protein